MDFWQKSFIVIKKKKDLASSSSQQSMRWFQKLLSFSTSTFSCFCYLSGSNFPILWVLTAPEPIDDLLDRTLLLMSQDGISLSLDL